MSFGNAPTPPDPTATSNAQQKYNLGAGTSQQNLNMVNQQTPTGSLTYTQIGTNPDGTPKYSATSVLSPAQQQLYDQYVQTQGITGNTAQNLAKNVSSMYSTAPDFSQYYSNLNPSVFNNLDPSSTLKQLQGWQQSYVNPIFQQQESNLDSKLRAQGILPGSQAYNNAQNLQARNEGDVNNQFFSTAEPLAYNQALSTAQAQFGANLTTDQARANAALQDYSLPLSTYETLMNGTQPTAPNFVNTPTVQIQPPNYTGAVQNDYNAAVQNYQNQQNGAWGLAKAGLTVGGTMLGGPMGGALGGALGSGLQGMFGSTPNYGQSYNIANGGYAGMPVF